MLETIASQPSWVIRSRSVELAVTELGGHMAPVSFYRDTDQPVQPYYVSPWQDEHLLLDEPVLVPLRGDFFCLPFGGNSAPLAGEKHRVHGEPAGAKWALAGVQQTDGITALTLSLTTKVRPGKITKQLSLIDGHNVVYCRHILAGFTGRMPLGHHAILAVPELEGSLRVATSAFRFGLTYPVLFSNPVNREYQSFAVNQTFTDLRHVPLLWKEPAEADCTALPARTGFTDLLAVFSQPAAELRTPAWTTATNQRAGYLWFALRDPAALPTTVFWICNRGRHGVPWNGRNRCLGLEDVCAYFAEGLAASVGPNPLTEAGIPTAVELSPSRPTTISYIQGVARIPPDFDIVQSVDFALGQVTFVSPTGKSIATSVNHAFLYGGEL